mgnify:FL=1
MEIKKAVEAMGGGVATAAQMEAINAQAKGKLRPEDVYVFCVRLCDDQPDRDMDCFDTQALPMLARMFIGKTGVLDHQWRSDNQVARIFETQVVRDMGISYIKAWAYIRRGGHADELIADIEAGIKKEVSVGCAMASSTCSICGSEYGTCGHQKGEYYDGQVCCAILREPVDAYEFSFVAVPAQRSAGVLKAMSGKAPALKALAEEYGAQAEYRALFKRAQLGAKYEKQIQDDVVRLCLTLDLGATEPVLRSIVEKAGSEDLLQLKTALEQRMRQMMPVVTQLGRAADAREAVESGFLI